jgi:hypothetical protein
MWRRVHCADEGQLCEKLKKLEASSSFFSGGVVDSVLSMPHNAGALPISPETAPITLVFFLKSQPMSGLVHPYFRNYKPQDDSEPV